MRKHLAVGAVMALGFGTQVFAADEGFSYNLAEIGYTRAEIDDLDLKGDGVTLGGSVEFTPNVFGSFNFADVDYGSSAATSGVKLKGTTYSLGLGFNWALGPTLDLVSGASYEHIKLKGSLSGVSSSDSESGFGLNVGLRGRVAEQLELTGGVKYVDFGHGADDFTFGAGGRWYFTEAFAAGPDISHNDDGTAWGISFRYDFGKR